MDGFLWSSHAAGNETDCSGFLDARVKAQMLTTCLFQIPTFTFQHQNQNVLKYTAPETLRGAAQDVKLGIWFQMIAAAHAYALYKHEKAR